MNNDLLLVVEEIKQLLVKKEYPSTLPNVLYHYSNTSALLNIIKENQIYLSDIRGMNDYTEIYYGKNLVEKTLEEKTNIPIYKIIEKVERDRKNNHSNCSDLDILRADFYINIQLAEPFVFCLSAEKHLLSQWITYADDGQGFAIGFNTSVLKSMGIDKAHTHCNVAESRTILSPVIYHEDLQKKIIQLCLALFEIQGYANWEEFISLAKKINELPIYIACPSPIPIGGKKFDFHGQSFQSNKRDCTLSNFLHLIKIFKHEGYAAEKEYRIMKIPNYLTLGDTSDPKHYVEFRYASQRIVPYSPFIFKNNKAVLSEIIPGPDNINDMKHLEMLLRNYNFIRTKLSPKCNIPYRNNK